MALYVRALAASQSGSGSAAGSVETPGNFRVEIASKTIGELEVAAVAASAKKDYERAAELMKQAIGLEEQMGPPSGPPSLIKPSHELFGEILLRAGKP